MEALVGQIAELRALVTASDGRLAAQSELIGQASQKHADMQQRLNLAEGQSGRLATMLDELKATSERALLEMNNKVEEAKREARSDNGGRDYKSKLINNRDMKCGVFTGKEAYKPWAKKVKAYCNGLVSGFRAALDWAEKQTNVIDQTEMSATNWQFINEADQELYDLLVMVTAEDALTIVELSANHGFEAWRTLFRRMDPVGEDYEFEAAESLMSRPRCKDIVELPAAIERWQRDMNAYQERTGEKMPERWSVPVLFRMIPDKNYNEVKLRWRQDPEKDITKFMAALMQWANDLKFDQRRQRGPKQMDVDHVEGERDEEGYTLEDWKEYTKELEESVDWLGKGKRGRKGEGKGGKSGKGGCFWCKEPGHTKANCSKFAAWKKAKDEERKRKGLPPFKPGQKRSMDNVEGEDYEVMDGQESIGMLDADYECGALGDGDEEDEANRCKGECDCWPGSLEDWDEVGDATAMLEADELKRIIERQSDEARADAGTTATNNKFEALAADSEADVNVLGADDETPKRELFLAEGLYNSPASVSSGMSVAEMFAREREELLEAQAARMLKAESGKTSDAVKVHETNSLGKPPGLGSKEAEVQTDVGLPERVTITWIPVADSIDPVRDGPEPTAEDKSDADKPEAKDDVNAVDSITGGGSPEEADFDMLMTREIEDVIFEEVPAPPGPSAERRTRTKKGKGAKKRSTQDVRDQDVALQSTGIRPCRNCVEPLSNLHKDGHCGETSPPTGNSAKDATTSATANQPQELDGKSLDCADAYSCTPGTKQFLTVVRDEASQSRSRQRMTQEEEQVAEVVLRMLQALQMLASVAMALVVMMGGMEEEEGDPDKSFRELSGARHGPKRPTPKGHKPRPSKLFKEESDEDEFLDCEEATEAAVAEKVKIEADLDDLNKPESDVARMKLRRGITVDSGAHHNVMPRRLARGKIRPSEGSRRGMNYVSASKCRIPNEGETNFDFMTLDGIMQSWEFQIAEVNKALAAVSDRVDHDYRVVFDKDSKTGIDCSYMLHKPTNKIIKMTRINNVWIVEAIVDIPKNNSSSFTRRG